MPDGALPDAAEVLYLLRPVAGKPTRIPVPQAWLQPPPGIEVISWDGWAVVTGAYWHLHFTRTRLRPVSMPPPPGRVKERVYWTTEELSPEEAQKWALEVVFESGAAESAV